MYDVAMSRRPAGLVTAELLAMIVVGGVMVFGMGRPAQAQSIPEPPCTTDFCLGKTANPSTVSVGSRPPSPSRSGDLIVWAALWRFHPPCRRGRAIAATRLPMHNERKHRCVSGKSFLHRNTAFRADHLAAPRRGAARSPTRLVPTHPQEA